MVCSHRCSAEEGTSASLLPETAEEVWNEPQNPQILLHLDCGEHPDRLYHRLVWKQHRWQPQGFFFFLHCLEHAHKNFTHQGTCAVVM